MTTVPGSPGPAEDALPDTGRWDSIGTAAQLDWLRDEERRLIGFPRQFVTSRGDAPLLDYRGGTAEEVAPTFLTARLAYVAGIASMRSVAGTDPAVAQLIDYLASTERDGWYDDAGAPDSAPQSLYTLSFLIFAAATATIAGHEPARDLLDHALEILRRRFWDEDRRRGVDKVTRTGKRGSYRGVNANMHLVEALLAASDATGNEQWAAAAVDVCTFVAREASTRQWRINEHYDSDWTAVPDYNRDRPDHAYVPYGSTIGHGFEWSRLMSQAASAGSRGAELAAAAEALYQRAADDGWSADGAPGFLYTVDWNGKPVSRQRLHWVAAEAMSASATLARLTGGRRYADAFEQWRAHIDRYFLDRSNGSWFQRLDPVTLEPADPRGPKPDLYHSYQAVIAPQLPLSTSLARAVRSDPRP